MNLTHQRCFHHSLREAAARCPQCGHFYCRECITEHEGRVICAACLRHFAPTPSPSRRWWGRLVRLTQLAAAVVVAWAFFYQAGRLLLQLPTSFHEGTIWQGQGREDG